MGIKVIAIARGYHGQLREAGDEFEIENETAFAGVWMEKLDGKRSKRLAGLQSQATGNNPIGAKPHTGMDDLPNPADLT